MIVEQLVTGDLLLDGERHLAGLERVGAEDRKILEDDAQLRDLISRVSGYRTRAFLQYPQL